MENLNYSNSLNSDKSDSDNSLNDLYRNNLIDLLSTDDTDTEKLFKLKSKISLIRENLDDDGNSISNDWEEKLNKHIEDFNKKYAVVLFNGNTVVLNVKKNILDNTKIYGKDKISYIEPRKLNDLYKHETIQTGIKKSNYINKPDTIIEKNLFQAWFEHKNRKTYYDYTFQPNENVDDDTYNAWTGFRYQPLNNNSDTFILHHHIKEILCDNNEELYDYFIKWIAWGFQNPNLNAGVACVFKSEKGTGKGLIGDFLMRLWGNHFSYLNGNEMTKRFNSVLENCCFLFADEAFYAGSKQSEEVLKSLITQSTIGIEHKFLNKYDQPNFLKIYMATNSDWAIPASTDERRYFVSNVSNKRKGDENYFNELIKAIKNDDVCSKFMFEMMNMDLSNWSRFNVPESKGLQEQRLMSLDSIDEWIMDSLKQGKFISNDFNLGNVGNLGNDWKYEIKSSSLYDSYIRFCHNKRYDMYHIKSQTTFGLRLKNIFGKSKRKYDGIYIVFESLNKAKSLFIQAKKLPIDVFDDVDDVEHVYNDVKLNDESSKFKKIKF